MNLATYHRVSTDEQDPEGARADLLAWAAAQGHVVVEPIEETGSGADNDRPGLDRVLALAEAREVQIVAVWKLDRFGRSVLDLLANVRKLNQAGVTLVATSQGLALGPAAEPVQRLSGTMLAALAEYELAMIRERTRQAIDARKREIVRKGGFTARRSGIWRTRLGRPSLPEVDVQRIRDAMAEGLTPYWAAKRLGLKQSTVRRYMERLVTDTKKGPPKSEE
jgi:putative DNA-invertase from lambdoid prophage Rac